MRDYFSNKKIVFFIITFVDDIENQIRLRLQRMYVLVTYSGP